MSTKKYNRPKHRCHHKNTITKNQRNICLPEYSYPVTVCLEKCNIAEAHEKGCKVDLINMINILTKEVQNPSKKLI